MGVSNFANQQGLVPFTNITGDVSHLADLACFVSGSRASGVPLCIGDMVALDGLSVGQVPLVGAASQLTIDPMLVNSGAYPSIDLWSSGSVLGVVVGFEYDPERGKAGQKYLAATDSAVAHIMTDPMCEFLIYVNTTLTGAAQNKNAGITARSVNTTFGTPGFFLNAASLATTATLPLRVMRPANIPGNDITVANAPWVVRLNTSQLLNATGL